MNAADCLLIQVLRSPAGLAALGPRDWDALVCEARQGSLLGRLAVRAEELGLTDQIPQKVRNHLDSARTVAAATGRAVRWEVRHIRQALKEVGVPVILLKGAAYVLAGLPPARGRVCSDVDILVPRARLAEVEAALLRHGWDMTHADPYDQRYYRDWTHELPPLVHRERQTVLDVHHNLTPVVGRVPVDADELLAAARPLDGDGLWVLAPADMVLHCATHVFQDGEVDRALRDLADLDELLRHFGAEPGFAGRLLARARLLALVGPLWYAVAALRDLLGTPLPDSLTAGLDAGRPGWPAGLVRAAVRRALLPDYPGPAGRAAGLARWLLYLRAHWQRMPLPLLTYHLARKGLMSLFHRPGTA